MKKQITPDTYQWSNIDYKIQLATGKSSIKLISIYKYQHYQTDHKSLHNKTWVDAIINVTDLSKQYCRMVVDQKIPIQDVIFYAGHVNIHKYSSQPFKIFTFIICDLRLGLTGTAATPKLEECDSILNDTETENQSFQYNFLVKQHSQYKPKYQITFTVSDQKDFKLSEYQCVNCQNRPPTIYCSTQKIYFCGQCCADHHKTKLMHTHQLQAIDKINTLQICKNHNHKYQHYCTRCQKYLCNFCIQKGVHSQNNQHPVKPINYLYQQTLQNIQVLPKKPLEKLQILLENLRIKRKQIKQNHQEVRQQIQRQYRISLEKLNDEMTKKYQILDSCELELSLLKDRIQWSRSFALFQQNSLKPLYYFKSEAKFQYQVKNLRVSDFQPIFLCKPDIVYEVDTRIGTLQTVQKLRFRQKAPNQQNLTSINQEIQYIQGNNLVKYDQNSQTPKPGSLWLELETSQLNFFQIKTR